jgi:hypothetical protein
VTGTGHERRSAAPNLFRPGKRKIQIERHGLFTDPAARESSGMFVEAIVENFNRHLNRCNFDDWRKRRSRPKRLPAGIDRLAEKTCRA